MKRLMILAALCLPVPGFGASPGVIDCDEKTSVFAFERPGSMVAVRELYCNQSISIIGMERGFVEIRIDEHQKGFVEARHIRMFPSDQPQVAPTPYAPSVDPPPPALSADSRHNEGPRVFIDSVPYAKGNYSDASIISSTEIADRFKTYCPTCRITIQKESADYVIVFAAQQAGETIGRWNWALYENREGLLLKSGSTLLFNNSIKDSTSLMMAHWNNDADVR